MSMHEFEDVVEYSIRLLGKHEEEVEFELRAAFRALYDFQARFDTGFTNFRVMDHLLKQGYTVRFPKEEHPDYAHHKSYFDALDQFEFIHQSPGSAWADSNPATSYFNDGYCYCDLDSPLWEQLVEAGVIQGEKAVQPIKLSLDEVVAKVVTLAEDDGDRELIRMWHPLFIVGQDDLSGEALRSLQQNPYLQTIRDVTERTHALEIEMTYGYTELPPPEEIVDFPVLVWWFDLQQLGESPSIRKQSDRELTKSEATALMEIFQTDDVDRLRSKLDLGLSPNTVIQNQPLLLIAAGHPGRAKMLKLLVERGAKVDAKGILGITALAWAARCAYAENVQALLAAGANANSAIKGGLTPLMAAIYLRILKDPVRTEALPGIVQTLIEAGGDPNYVARDGSTPLHGAMLIKSYDTIEILLKSGADPDRQYHDGATPLHYAVDASRPDLVKLLLEHGADPLQINDHGESPMLKAVKQNAVEIIDLILKHLPGAILPQSEFGYTPLMWAAIHGSDLEVIEQLIRAGSDPAVSDSYGRTAVTFALINEQQAIIDWFQERYPDLEYRIPGRLGIQLSASPEEEWKKLQALGIDSGVPIGNVLRGSPADKAELQVNDLILKINDKPVHSSLELLTILRDSFDGDVVQCAIRRGEKELTITLTLRYQFGGQLKY